MENVFKTFSIAISFKLLRRENGNFTIYNVTLKFKVKENARERLKWQMLETDWKKIIKE